MRTIFVDMDGTIVNFRGPALALLSAADPCPEEWDFITPLGFSDSNDPKFWERTDFSFWSGLPWTEEGKELLEGIEAFCHPDQIHVLTSPARSRGCVDGKMAWIEREIPRYIDRVHFSKRKHVCSGSHSLLIDDNEGHCDAFRKRGTAYMIPRPWNSARHLCLPGGRFDVKPALEAIRSWYLWG